MGLHPSEILNGYEKAGKYALEIMEKLTCYTMETPRDVKALTAAVKPAVASKRFGQEDHLAGMIAQASVYCMPNNPTRFSVENIRVQKILGGGLSDSEVVHGMVVTRRSETTHTSAQKCKIAVFNTNIEMNQGELKGTVLLNNADELLNYTKSEEDQFELFIKGLADAGITVVVCSGSCSELAIHFFEKYKMVIVKIMSKWELKRIARSIGATPVVNLKTPQPGELGYAVEVSYREISSRWCTVFRTENDENKLATIVLRGATNAQLDDIERAIDDGVNTIKSLVRDPRMCPGAGASEMYCAHMVGEMGKKDPSLAQYAIEKFGQSFEIFPRTLAENAGLKADTIMAELYAGAEKGLNHGIDCNDGKVKDVNEAQIWDVLDTKTWALKLALDVVLTILKVD
jgi:T-complex protein 1 subunit theta